MITVVGIQSDDHGATPPEATEIEPGNVDIPGRIDFPGDVDTFKVTPDKTGKLAARVIGIGNGMQPRLRVLDPSGAVLGEAVDQPGGLEAYPFVNLSTSRRGRRSIWRSRMWIRRPVAAPTM